MAVIKPNDITQWTEFLFKNPKAEFIWLRTLSYTANTYIRIIPVAKFTQMVKANQYLALPKAAFFLAPGDHLAKGGSPSGSFCLRPDFETAHCQQGSNGTRVVIQCDCIEKDGSPMEACARSRLRDLCSTLQNNNSLIPLIGFEIEVVFMKLGRDQDGTPSYTPLSENHSWSCITEEDFAHMDVIEQIVRSLQEVDISLEHLHAEAAPGQWEFVLPPDSPVKAIDTLLKARETIRNVSRAFGVHATLYPRTSPEHAGTGAHVHVSVNDAASKDCLLAPQSSDKQLSFFAGMIHHLPSILAFSLAQEASYERLMTGIWSGGEYACWGWENKETALRRVADNRFELKLMDGLANPYLALCAIMSAGLDGVRNKMPLTAGDCNDVPAELDPEEREALGIRTLLPKNLQESLAALEVNPVFSILVGDSIVSTYLSVKHEEAEILQKMTDRERRNWLISRY